MEGQTDDRECGRRYSESDYSQADRGAGALGRGMRFSDPIFADASGVCPEHRVERARAREGKLPDDHQREALAAAVSNSGAGKRTTQPGGLSYALSPVENPRSILGRSTYAGGIAGICMFRLLSSLSGFSI